MNTSISENVVKYRIKHKKERTHAIGEFIKKERIAQGLKQELVCRGICSVSYYSRIENNRVDPAEHYVAKIFKKLNKPVPATFESEYDEESCDTIRMFLHALDFMNNEQIKKAYAAVRQLEHINRDLYEFIYHVYFQELQSVEGIIKLLHSEQNYMSNDELLLFLEYTGLYYLFKDDYQHALTYFEYALLLQKHLNIEKASIFFRYAWVLGKQNQLHLSIAYSIRASDLYQREHNLYCYICSRMLLGRRLIKIIPERSVEIFQECLGIAACASYPKLDGKIKYLLWQAYKSLKDYEHSEKILFELIDKGGEPDKFRFDVYLELIDLYLVQNKQETAQNFYQKLKGDTPLGPSHDFYLKYYAYQLYRNLSLDEEIKLYKSTFIPYFLKHNEFDKVIKSRYELASLYETRGAFQESLEEYKKICESVNYDQNIF